MSPRNSVMRTNVRILRSSLTLRPFDDVPDGAWAELTDPVGFVVGSLLLLFYKSRPAHPDPVVAGQLAGRRFGATAIVAFVVAMPVLVGLLFPSVSTGDALAYALTLLAAGAVTFVPGRIAELRDKGRVRGNGYPRKLRKVMWYIESAIVTGALLAMTVWKFGGPGNHQVWRAIVWGLFAVSAAELETNVAVRSLVAGEQALTEENTPLSEVNTVTEHAPSTEAG